MLAIDVNAVATVFEVIATFCPVTTNRWKQIMFVVTGKNVVISTNRVATALTSKAKM